MIRTWILPLDLIVKVHEMILRYNVQRYIPPPGGERENLSPSLENLN